MIDNLILIFLLMLLGIIVCSYISYGHGLTDQPSYPLHKLNQRFYDPVIISPHLNGIYRNLDKITEEVINIRNMIWYNWPEKQLYDTDNNKDPEWTIFPFFAFGIKVEDNIKQCPELWRFIKTIPGVKVAILSRLGPDTKLNENRGWGSHSNHVIRCHFGFDVPDGCYLAVRDKKTDRFETRYHMKNKWLCFDDSKYHFAHNPSDKDRIVLIIDIERPSGIATGTSDVNDTKELKQIVDYFKHHDKELKTVE